MLKSEQLGDRKTSKLLCDMRALASNRQIDDSVLPNLFFQLLPSHVKSILQVQPTLPLDQLGEIANRVVEVSLLSLSPTILTAGDPQHT